VLRCSRDSGAVVLAVVASWFCTTAAVLSGPPTSFDGWTFVGTVLEIEPGSAGPNKVIPVDVDPRYRLRLAIQGWRGEAGPWPAGSVVVLAIHSPALLFGVPDTRSLLSARHLFRLSAQTDVAGPVFRLRSAAEPVVVMPDLERAPQGASPPAGDGKLPLANAPTSAPSKPPPSLASGPTMAEVLAASHDADWRPLDPENTLYVELPAGRVIVELTPAFAPAHVANLKTLVRAGYFDGLAVVRSQDNYVVQWGDPDGDDPAKARAFGNAQKRVPAEMDRAVAADLPFALLPDGDVYASQVGHSLGFPVARDPQGGRTWLAHCYGMVGAGRGDTAESGNGAELYVVIGPSPRHLDRNVTLLGRVVQGMELLSTLPRGDGPLGFYTPQQARTPVRALRIAADLPAGQRVPLEALRTDTATFQKLVDARRIRREAWFLQKTARIDLCNVPLPVRVRATAH
jgi:peptidylprolyl isomerase